MLFFLCYMSKKLTKLLLNIWIFMDSSEQCGIMHLCTFLFPFPLIVCFPCSKTKQNMFKFLYMWTYIFLVLQHLFVSDCRENEIQRKERLFSDPSPVAKERSLLWLTFLTPFLPSYKLFGTGGKETTGET